MLVTSKNQIELISEALDSPAAEERRQLSRLAKVVHAKLQTVGTEKIADVQNNEK